MYRIVEGTTFGLADVVEFVDLINTPPERLLDLFDPGKDVFVARAPGRLDVMGGIADYSGSLVLEMPIAEATFVALQKRRDRRIKIVSLAQDSLRDFVFEMLLPAEDEITDYEVLRDSFVEKSSDHWASYVAGVFFVLMKELGVEFHSGANILISSDIPIGKGVSSSAALEVATMQATCAAFDIDLEARRFAALCQLVENRVVGAPCGIMDQLTSHCGTANSLLPILCQPAEIGEGIKIPEELDLWGIDSGVRHAVAGSDYTSVRVGAFMGYRIIAESAGLEARSENGMLQVDDPHWRGYLSNVSETEYEQRFSSAMPESIVGWEFLDKYGGITDKVTKIDPERSYPVRAATEHAIYENARVSKFIGLLKSDNRCERLDELGDLMFRSHDSYRNCGLTEPGTDRIVELVRENHENGLFGARITGGGSGGTVAILSRASNEATIAKIASTYEKESGGRAHIFHGSSPGCASFGFLKLSGLD